MSGNMRPPVAEPVLVTAMATTFLEEKYVDTWAIKGGNTMPKPIPMATPCERNRCQYFVLKLEVNMPTSCRTAPMSSAGFRYPAS